MTDTLVGPGGAVDRATRPIKAASAFRTISEVADELDVAQHVLRFWESKFPQVRPLKRGGGRRYYRPEDIDLLRRIRSLLYDEGYTIKGVQKLLRVRRRAGPAPADSQAERLAVPEPPSSEPVAAAAEPSALPFAEDAAPGPANDLTEADRHRLLAELHAELMALIGIALGMAEQLKPSLSPPKDGAIDPPARSVAQPG